MVDENMRDLAYAIDKMDKAYQETGNATDYVQIEKIPELQSRTAKEQTFLEFLEINNRTRDVKGSAVVFYEETGGSNAEFIAETGAIPTNIVTEITPVTEYTKTIATPIQVSMKAQDGTTDFDLKQHLIEEGYIKVNNLIDKTLLQGEATNSNYEFNAITTGVETIDNNDEPISEIVIKNAIRDCTRNNGHPDCIVTTADIANQLDDLVNPYLRYTNTMELTLGHTVSLFKSTEGNFIPILVDDNVPDGQLNILDSSSIDVAYQCRPAFITLAQDRLATNEAIFSWVTGYNRAKFKSRVITDIGEADPSGSDNTESPIEP